MGWQGKKNPGIEELFACTDPNFPIQDLPSRYLCRRASVRTCVSEPHHQSVLSSVVHPRDTRGQMERKM